MLILHSNPGLNSLEYLTDHDSHCKDCISFINIRNKMILHAKKMLVSKQYEYFFHSSANYVINKD